MRGTQESALQNVLGGESLSRVGRLPSPSPSANLAGLSGRNHEQESPRPPGPGVRNGRLGPVRFCPSNFPSWPSATCLWMALMQAAS
jgi:hypothetical protein